MRILRAMRVPLALLAMLSVAMVWARIVAVMSSARGEDLPTREPLGVSGPGGRAATEPRDEPELEGSDAVTVDRSGGLARRILRLELKALAVAALAVGLVLGSAPFTAPATRAAEPRVVIVVGPVGSLTAKYIATAERAAAEARRHTSDVVTLYSPDATWPAVRSALQGASIVIYLGHGNGFPSPYGTVLRPAVQDGFGLNPVAGVDDVAHQYFGEAYLAKEVRLAPDAVVLLHRLCYASGNSEPGLPEGDLATGQARVDNFAAGFLAAGASAVVADAYADPAFYVRRLLTGSGTVEAIWRNAPTAHGNVLAFPSTRSPGLAALMDPTNGNSGFLRSLVTKATLRADEVRRGASLAARDPIVDPGPPVGPTVGSLALEGVPTAGTTATLAMTFEDRAATAGLGLGVRWDALELDPVSEPVTEPPSTEPTPTTEGGTATADAVPVEPDAAPADATTDAAPGSVAGPGPEPVPEPRPDPSPEATEPIAEATPEAPPEIELVAAEVPGAVVRVTETAPRSGGLSAPVEVPAEPGLYRLVVTLHDPDGVAFAAVTQERIPALVVRVTGSLSASLAAPARLELRAAATATVPVAVLNSGTIPWYSPLPDGDPAAIVERLADGTWGARLVGHWVALSATPDDGLPPDAATALAATPGSEATIDLELTAPATAGDYLLVIDVLSPLYGSLTALGSPATVVRVAVTAPSEPPASLD